jgi:hypothetical protein
MMSTDKLIPFVFQVIVTIGGLYISIDHKFQSLENRITILEAKLSAKNIIAHQITVSYK